MRYDPESLPSDRHTEPRAPEPVAPFSVRRVLVSRTAYLDPETLKRVREPGPDAIMLPQGAVVAMRDLGPIPPAILDQIPFRGEGNAAPGIYLPRLQPARESEPEPAGEPRARFSPPGPEAIPGPVSPESIPDPQAPALAPPLDARPKRRRSPRR